MLNAECGRVCQATPISSPFSADYMGIDRQEDNAPVHHVIPAYITAVTALANWTGGRALTDSELQRLTEKSIYRLHGSSTDHTYSPVMTFLFFTNPRFMLDLIAQLEIPRDIPLGMTALFNLYDTSLGRDPHAFTSRPWEELYYKQDEKTQKFVIPYTK
ncbi:hypothetical protein CEK25_003253 [Fusarium fujikuroi]|nr:hypothetical protein CEK25_003253 [Fusarium fujikuroi]